jgi:hypothetical protein
LDASSYEIDAQTVAGFDLIEIDGFGASHVDGAVMPGTELELPLPRGAQVTAVELQVDNELQLGKLDIPNYTPGVPLGPFGDPPVWEAIPTTTGTVPEEQMTSEVREGVRHVTLHAHLTPVVYDAATKETKLFRRLVVRVVYDVSEPVAVTEFEAVAPRVAPSGTVTTMTRVVNVTDLPVELVPTLTIFGIDGQEVASASGESFTVGAGETMDVSPSCPAPAEEGSHAIQLELVHDSEIVARADTTVEVSGGHIAEYTVPERAVPGTPIEFSVTYANTSSGAVEATFELVVLDFFGRVEDSLEPVTRTVAAGGQETVTWSWDSRVVPLGYYKVRAKVTPDGAAARTSVRLIDTRRGGPRPRHPARRHAPSADP